MRTLVVENFSVIKRANLDFGRITVLIGPQSSGKSILCKISFFSHELLIIAQRTLEEGESYDKFLQIAGEEFVKLFPQQSWGTGRFRIHYRYGNFALDIVRRRYTREPRDKAALSLSPWFVLAYKRAHQRLLSSKRRTKDQLFLYSFRREFQQLVDRKIGDSGIGSQLFVPAGRSFFSSVGKALAVFEEGGSIDPLTLRFGRQVTWDEDLWSYLARTKKVTDLRNKIREESRILLGGFVREEKEKAVFVATDGRTMPLSNLSSGQQELIPLLSTLQRRVMASVSQMLYIEEPEAHLFPSAQATLVSLFSQIAQDKLPDISIVLTTHSPYILSKFNNLVLAGQLARRRKLREQIESFIPSEFWIREGTLKAYSIEEGKTKNIVAETGLIDGEYLDRVSETIGDEFDRLLGLEYGDTTTAGKK
jgi:ABC-type cobalamin/Fe3+-siderophores transport system ATPase subunit